MSKSALTKLTYGLYILSSKFDDAASGCIIDACIQAGTNPDRILISVMNSNYTKYLIEHSHVFNVAVLEDNCSIDVIRHYGYQSGRDVDKFKGMTTFTDIHGVPCDLSCVCATISARVITSIDLGSHTVFIGEVKDQKLLADTEPMSYAYYQEYVRSSHGIDPKKKSSEPKIIGWKCSICGYVYSDSVLPDDYTCPVCGHPSTDFIPIYE